MKDIFILDGADIRVNSAMRSLLSSKRDKNRTRKLITSVYTAIEVRSALRRLTVKNDCILINGISPVGTVPSTDEDKFYLEHNVNEIYFKNRLITDNFAASIPMIISNIQKILAKRVKDRRVEIILSVQTERFPSITIFIHSHRENFDHLGDIKAFRQPVLQMIF